MKSRHLTSHLVALAYVVMLVVNWLAGAGVLNDTSPGDISDRYSTAISPAGYAFSIWSIIYLGLGAFAVFQWLPRQQGKDLVLSQVRVWFLASCAANVGWLFAWHYDAIGLSLLVMMALLGTLVVLNRRVSAEASGLRLWVLKVTFNVYLGWIVVASTLNLLIWTAYMGTDLGNSAVVGALAIAGAAGIGVWLARVMESVALPLAMAWGVTAIAVGHRDALFIAIVASAAALVLVGTAVARAIRPATKRRRR